MASASKSRGSNEGSSRGRGKNKRYWLPEEDEVLLQSLLEISAKWKSENGFKSGYMNRLEDMIKMKLPHSGLCADPHIESRLKHWSEKYSAMAELLGTSGFGWDDERKMLTCEKDVFDAWVKAHPKAKGLFRMPFPHYEILAEIYGKDRATGNATESFSGAIKDMEVTIEQEHVTVETDDDEDDADSAAVTSGNKEKRREEADPPLKKSKRTRSLSSEKMFAGKVDATADMAASFKSVSSDFGKIFGDMNSNLAAMAKTWSKAEEREQLLDEQANNVLEEIMKLDCISPSEALESATILMAAEHKLRVFYQAPTSFRKQYIMDLLRKK